MELQYGVKVGYFLWSLVLGMVLCLIYDFVRSGRRLAKLSAFWVTLEDGLFLLLAGILLFWVAYDKNGGSLRWQGFLGVALGAAGYYFVFRNRVVNLTVRITESVICAAVRLVRVLLIPVQVVYRILAKPFLVIAWYSRKSVSKAERILKIRRRKHQLRSRREKLLKENRKKQSFR